MVASRQKVAFARFNPFWPCFSLFSPSHGLSSEVGTTATKAVVCSSTAPPRWPRQMPLAKRGRKPSPRFQQVVRSLPDQAVLTLIAFDAKPDVLLPAATAASAFDCSTR